VLTRQGWLLSGLAVGLLVVGRILGTLELTLLGATVGALVLITVAFIALSKLRIRLRVAPAQSEISKAENRRALGG